MTSADTDVLVDQLVGYSTQRADAVTTYRERWERSQEDYHADYDLRYVVERAEGARMALGRAIAALQPENALPEGRTFRTDDGDADFRALARWLEALRAAAEESKGGRVDDNGARGAEEGFLRALVLLKTEYGVQWERTDDFAADLTEVPEWP